MSGNRLPDYLDHMQQAATDACGFTQGLGKAGFLEDKRTQQAVIMSLIIIGEAATKVMDGYAEFTRAHPAVPWRSIRGMRNRIAHGYFDINLRSTAGCRPQRTLSVLYFPFREQTPPILQVFYQVTSRPRPS